MAEKTTPQQAPSNVKKMLERLVSPRPRGNGTLQTAKARNALVSPMATSQSDPDTQTPISGLLPPFTEDETQREYYAEENLTDSSGLFVMVVAPFKKRVFTDSAGQEATYNYSEPD